MKLLPWLAASVSACPYFVEFLPDPVDVPDKEGEFVEIRLDPAFTADSLAFSVRTRRGRGLSWFTTASFAQRGAVLPAR